MWHVKEHSLLKAVSAKYRSKFVPLSPWQLPDSWKIARATQSKQTNLTICPLLQRAFIVCATLDICSFSMRPLFGPPLPSVRSFTVCFTITVQRAFTICSIITICTLVQRASPVWLTFTVCPIVQHVQRASTVSSTFTICPLVYRKFTARSACDHRVFHFYYCRLFQRLFHLYNLSARSSFVLPLPFVRSFTVCSTFTVCPLVHRVFHIYVHRFCHLYHLSARSPFVPPLLFVGLFSVCSPFGPPLPFSLVQCVFTVWSTFAIFACS
jgi:hypothetical protein